MNCSLTQRFKKKNNCKKHWEQFFAEQNKIIELPEKWQKIVEQNSKYTV